MEIRFFILTYLRIEKITTDQKNKKYYTVGRDYTYEDLTYYLGILILNINFVVEIRQSIFHHELHDSRKVVSSRCFLANYRASNCFQNQQEEERRRLSFLKYNRKWIAGWSSCRDFLEGISQFFVGKMMAQKNNMRIFICGQVLCWGTWLSH